MTFNAQTIKTDIALLLPMLAGIAGLFGLTLNVPGVSQTLNDILDALFIVVPLVLQVFRELTHLKVLSKNAPVSQMPPAPPPTLPAT